MTSEENKYIAFISYSHRDARFAEWLHRKLEGYNVPQQFIGTASKTISSIPKKLFPIFRDREELPVSAKLSDNIRAALEKSRFLIVICSPDSAQSRWVNEEIRMFKQTKGADAVLPIIIRGEPNVDLLKTPSKERECFPDTLRFAFDENGVLTQQRIEPVSADVRETGDGRERALIKIIAGILGVDFNSLWDREKRRKRKLTYLLTIALSVIFLTISGLSVFSNIQWRRADQGKRAEQKARLLAQHNLSAARIQSSRLERNNLRYIPARRYAAEAMQAETSLSSRLAVWDMLARTPVVSRQFFLSENESNACVSLENGRIAYASDSAVVVIDSVGNNVVRTPLNLNNVFSMSLLRGTAIIAVRSNNKEWYLIDIQTKRVLAGPRSDTSSAGISMRDARTIAVSQCDGTVAVYSLSADFKSYRQDKRIRIFNGEKINSCVFSADGRLLGISGEKGVVVYDYERQRRLWSLSINDCLNMVFSPTGERLAFGGTDGIINIVDARTGEPQLTIPTGCAIYDFKFSPDGEHLSMVGEWISGEQRHPSWVEWDAFSGTSTLVFEASESFSAFTYLNDNNIILFSSGTATSLKRPELWQRGTHNGVVRVIENDRNDEKCHVLRLCNSDSSEFAKNIFFDRVTRSLGTQLTEFSKYGSCRGSIEVIWSDLTSQNEFSTMDVSTFTMLDSCRLLVGLKDGEIRIFNHQRDDISKPLYSFHDPITFLRTNHDGIILVGVNEENGYHAQSGIYSISDSSLTPMLIPIESDLGITINSTAGIFSVDGKKAVIALSGFLAPGADMTSKIVRFNIADKKVLRSIDVVGGMIRAIHPLSSSNHFVIGNAGGSIIFLNSETWKFDGMIQAGTLPVFSLSSVFIDGKELLIAGDEAGTIRFIDPDKRDILYETDPSGQPISTIAPDRENGRILIGTGRQLWSWHLNLDPDSLAALIDSVSLKYDEEILLKAQELEHKGDLAEAAHAYEKLVRGSKVNQISFLQKALSLYREAGMFKDAFRVLKEGRKAELAQLEKRNSILNRMQYNDLRFTYYGNHFALNNMAWEKTHDTLYLKNAIANNINSLYSIFREPEEELGICICGHSYIQSNFTDAGDYSTAQIASSDLLHYIGNHYPASERERLVFYSIIVFNNYLSTINNHAKGESDSLLSEWSKSLPLPKESAYCRQLLLGYDTARIKLSDLDTAFHARILYLKGVINLQLRHRTAAKRFFRMGLQRGDFHGLCRFQLDRISGKPSKLFDTDKLSSEYEPLLKYLRSRVLDDRGETSAALREIRTACDRAKAVNRPFPLGWYWKSVYFRKLAMIDSADAALDEAMLKDSLFLYALQDKSQYHANRKEWEPALHALKVYQELTSALYDAATPKMKADLFGNLAYYSLMCRNYSDAIQFSRTGLSLDSSQIWIAANLAHGLLLSGQKEEAWKIYRRFKDTFIPQTRTSFSGEVLKDFKTLREAGIECADFERVEALYGLKSTVDKMD